MYVERSTRTDWLVRRAPATATAVLTSMMLAAGGASAAAAQPGSAAAQRPGSAAAGIISTVAGGIGGPGLATKVAVSSCGVAVGNGHLYVADNAAVRQVSPATDQLTTPAGTGLEGSLGDGGPATNASLLTCGVAVDHSGNLLIGDGLNNRVRAVAASTGTFYGQAMTAGHIYTIAGDGAIGFSGDGGPATSAALSAANVAVDAAGNVLITDIGNNRIRVVAASTGTFYGQAMTAGNIYTIAGGGKGTGNGAPATNALLKRPAAVTTDAAGNLLIADTNRNRIQVVPASTGTFYGQVMTAGHIYTIAGTGRRGFTGDNKPAVTSDLNRPVGVTVDAAGNVLVPDTLNNRIRVVAASTGTFYGQAMTAGHIYTVAGNGNLGFSGDGGLATKASLNLVFNVTADAHGNLVLSDFDNERIRVVAGHTGTFYGQAMIAGHIYTVAGDGVFGFSGDGGPATLAAFNHPQGTAVDAAGNLLICDSDNDRIRVVAASTGMFYGQAMTAGDIYTIAGGRTSGLGDGGPATQADLNPRAVVVTAAGDLLIADGQDNRIRMVTP